MKRSPTILATLGQLLICSLVWGQTPPVPKAVEAKNGMVVAVCPIATAIGVEILKADGSAVDAAVAVAFAEAVSWPEAGNIGGGGFMLVAPANGEPTFFDYREKAPSAATKTLFSEAKIDMYSPKVSGVPGTVRGMELAHKKFGKLPWKQVVAPAIKLATDGVLLDAPLARRLNGVLFDGKTKNAEFLRVYGKVGGARWAAGDVLKLPDLAATLTQIAERGSDGFYTGPVADAIVAEMKAHGGIMTLADLKNYQAVERKPMRGTYRGYDIIASPPPSSGGTAIIEALNILETFDLTKEPRYSPTTMHRIAEAQRRAFADRAKHLGDPDFVQIPPELVSKSYAKTLASRISPEKATPSETLGPPLTPVEGGSETTHFSIIDKSGLCVANTYTLENSFGNRVVVPTAGFILNNEMTDFNVRPGMTTKTGGIGSEPNQIAPGKRMLSSMTPTIVFKDGKPYLITGSPGGRTIINTVLCVLVNVLDYDMPAQDAVNAPRQHQQWFPDRLLVEKAAEHAQTIKKLQEFGHNIATSNSADVLVVGKAPKSNYFQGDAHTIRIDPKTGLYQGAADRRLNGKALGY